MMLAQLCLMLSCVHMVNGQAWNLVPCDGQPSSYQGPPLPTLPDQFQTHIEAKFVQQNKTRNFIEFYDYPGNRGVIVDYNKTTRETVRIVLNFNETKARIIFKNKTCSIFNTTSHGGSFMGDGAHIKPMRDLLYFGKDKGEVFIDGDQKVRGIPVNHWRTCVKVPKMNGTFTLDYYFSKGSQYLIDGSDMELPVRAVVNGTGKSRLPNGSLSEEFHSYYHIYDFIDFKPELIHDPKLFEIPVGVICNQGDLKDSEPAPVMSHQFTAGMEKVLLRGETEMHRQSMQIYSDFSAQILRLDMDLPEGQDLLLYGGRPVTYIYDYQTSLTYIIDRLERNCSVTRLATDRRSDRPRLRPPTVISQFYDDYSSFIYQGQKSWRGMPVDSWGFYNSSLNEITEIFFHRPQQDGPGRLDPRRIDKLIPVGLYKTGHGPFHPPSPVEMTMTTYEHLYGFTNGHPDPEVFDVSMCYAEDHHSTYLALDVTGRDVGEILRFHQKEFISEVRQTIATAAKVSATRVAWLKWEESRSTGTSTTLIVTFELLDNKLFGLDGSVNTGPSLSDAISNLQEAINSGSSLVFDLKLSSSSSVYGRIDPFILYNSYKKTTLCEATITFCCERFSILEGSLWEVYKEDKSEYKESSSSIKKYGSGSMAGLAIGMLVIGALLGLAAAFLIYKRFSTEVPYKVSE